MTQDPEGLDPMAGLPGVDWSQLEGHANGENVPPPEEGVLEVISPEMLAKRLLWDVAPCNMVEQVRDLLGYSPASSDVEDMEHSESHLRLAAASVAYPIVAEMAKHAAQGIVGSMIVGSGDDIPDAVREDTIEKIEPVILMSSFAIIAELLDVGILHFPHFGYLEDTEQ